jgi:hypothetical protein
MLRISRVPDRVGGGVESGGAAVVVVMVIIGHSPITPIIRWGSSEDGIILPLAVQLAGTMSVVWAERAQTTELETIYLLGAVGQ